MKHKAEQQQINQIKRHLKALFAYMVLFFLLPMQLLSNNDVDEKIKQQVDSLIRVGIAYFQNNVDSGLIFSQKALRLSELHNYEKGRINALRGIAVFHNQLNRYDLARDYIQSSLSFAKKLGDKKILAGVYFSYGFIEAENTHFDKAFEALTNASELFLELGDSAKFAYVLNNMGNLYQYNNEYVKALEIFKKALEISLKFDTYYQEVLITSNIGLIYNNLNQLDSSLRYYNMSLDILKADDLRNKALILQGLGGAYFNADSLILAEDYFRKALQAAKKMADSKIIGYNYGRIGEVFLERKAHDSAIYYLNIAHDTLLLTTDYMRLQEVTNSKVKYYKAINNFEKALEYTNLEAVYNDSIKSKENTERLAKLKAAQEYEAKIANEQLLYTKRISLFIGLSFVLALVIVLIIRGYVKQRKKAILSVLNMGELKNDIKQKDVDLLTKTMHLNEKEELIRSLEDKLRQLSREVKPSKARDVQNLISEIRVSKTDNIWEEFESRFSSVNDDFLERLTKKFPGLTPKELRLCSLLRLNLSTKEISSITHQNPLSINKARFRLRKKLDLNNTEINLTTFLLEF